VKYTRVGLLLLGMLIAIGLPALSQNRGGDRGSTGVHGDPAAAASSAVSAISWSGDLTGSGSSPTIGEAGLLSLKTADAGAGLPYTTAANTWSRVAPGTDLCPYFSSPSAMVTASCVSYGRGLLGYASEATFKAGVNLEANTDFYAPGGTDVALADGGHGSSTAAGARDAIEHAGAGSIACASPCTPAAGVKRITVAGTTTIVLPALSTYADGQLLTVICDSASSCPVTLDPSDSGTCDGGSAGAACTAITVAAHGTVGAVRTSSSAWGSVQPGSVNGGDRSILLTTSGSAFTAYEQQWDGDSWETASTLTVNSETTTCDVSIAGGVITLPSGAAASTSIEGQCVEYYVLLSAASTAFDTQLAATSTVHMFAFQFSAVETTANARVGCALAQTAGTTFASASEAWASGRMGWDGANYSWQWGESGGIFAIANTDDGLGIARVIGAYGYATDAIAQVDDGAGVFDSEVIAVKSTPPDRLYFFGGAVTGATAADTDYTGFQCRYTLATVGI
jgi:hypothetical protein